MGNPMMVSGYGQPPAPQQAYQPPAPQQAYQPPQQPMYGGTAAQPQQAYQPPPQQPSQLPYGAQPFAGMPQAQHQQPQRQPTVTRARVLPKFRSASFLPAFQVVA